MNFCALFEEKLALSCAFDCSCASEIVWGIASLLILEFDALSAMIVLVIEDGPVLVDDGIM